jgi:L-ascorbate metabolism protein UlaG (beta-lactamase superfamily)
MDITYLGHASFLFKSKDARVVMDPFDSSKLNMPFPKVEADIVTISHHHDDHNAASVIDGNPLVIDLPGEYEKNGVRVYGFESYHDKNQGQDRGKNTMFKFEMEDISILHCGDLGHTLSAEAIDEIGDVDVVLVPVGGIYTIDADEARHIVEKLEPYIVIPMHYRNPALQPNISQYAEMAPVEDFLTKVGVTGIEPVKKLSIKQSDFGEEDTMKIVVMETA